MSSVATVAVIGGSGLYRLFDGLPDAREVAVETPYGPPSEAPVVATLAGRGVAFIPRHGRRHQFPPHRIPSRANLWALRSLGVEQVLAPSAVGSLHQDVGPGRLVVPDQVVDRTNGRTSTYYDDGAVHVEFAEPYCPTGRAAALTAATNHFPQPPVDGGTMVVVEGPRFSSRAESQWHAAQGWSVVGMTGLPEAALARELALCYTSLCLVTDHDAGSDSTQAVSHQAVLDTFAESLPLVRATVLDAVTSLPLRRTCRCGDTLDGLRLPITLP